MLEMVNINPKVSYEDLEKEFNIATKNLMAFKSENESLQREIENLKRLVAERNNTIDRMNSAISAYRESLMIVSGKKKR